MTRMEELNSAATEVAAMLQTHGGVPRLVRALNRQRTHNVNVGAAYPFLAGSLLCMLNRCLEHNDIDAVLNAMMLAQSFYRCDDGPSGDGSGGGVGGDGGSGMRGSSGGGKREFLKTALEKHPLWRDESFWHQALQLCVAKQQLQLSTLRSAERALEDGYNDEVNADGSRIEYEQIDHNILCWQIAAEDGPDDSEDAAEQVKSTNTIIFAQMGGIVHSMLEFGLAKDEVQGFVSSVCEENEMGEEHREMLMAHVAASAR
mmetsp:Transcript_64303/g.177984  ORF Transcript_64303/g.177984 Transcript_64303/m.177984 type:complete len:259 (-) Transcript_64303:1048-1824(-)